MGTFEASECDSGDMVSRFSNAIVNDFSDLFETGEITKIYTECVDVVNCMWEK